MAVLQMVHAGTGPNGEFQAYCDTHCDRLMAGPLGFILKWEQI